MATRCGIIGVSMRRTRREQARRPSDGHDLPAARIAPHGSYGSDAARKYHDTTAREAPGTLSIGRPRIVRAGVQKG